MAVLGNAMVMFVGVNRKEETRMIRKSPRRRVKRTRRNLHQAAVQAQAAAVLAQAAAKYAI